eukprot:6213842-Pleurochrysis_carterae.AAC.2
MWTARRALQYACTAGTASQGGAKSLASREASRKCPPALGQSTRYSAPQWSQRAREGQLACGQR